MTVASKEGRRSFLFRSVTPGRLTRFQGMPHTHGQTGHKLNSTDDFFIKDLGLGVGEKWIQEKSEGEGGAGCGQNTLCERMRLSENKYKY